MISFDDFINILFDKETQEQFLKECEELGIEMPMEEKAATAKSTPPMIGKGGNNDGHFNDTL